MDSGPRTAEASGYQAENKAGTQSRVKPKEFQKNSESLESGNPNSPANL